MIIEGMNVEELQVDAVLWSPKRGTIRPSSMAEALESYSLGLVEKVATRGNGSWLVLCEQTGAYVIRLSRPMERPIVEPHHAGFPAVAIGG